MLEIRKVEKTKEEKPPYWFLRHGQPWLKCPRGHIARFNHEISDDGTVSPSVVCPEQGCRFHEMIRLLDWSGL